MTFQTNIPELADLRARVLRGEEIAPEEYAIVLDSIRRHRREGAAKKAAKAGPAFDPSLLDNLLTQTK